MADILNITDLGRVEIVETYVYYDQPVLFSCKSAAGHLYLAVATDKNDEYETWLYVGVSVERLNLIRSGAIDLHDAFAKPEDGFLLQEIIPSDDHTQPRMERIQPDQISEDMLPMPGERLDLEIETLSEKQIRVTDFSQSNSRSASGTESKPDFVHTDTPIIDCDLHNRLPSHQMLYPYLPDYWCDYCEESGFPGPDANDYPEGVPTSTRPEITHPSEDRPASDLALLRKHALDFWGVECGILTCGYRVQSVHNEDLAAALASAVNDWQIEHWLNPEPRLRASLIVPSQNPELAVREIERLGGHPRFVQIMLPARSQAPYGNRRYHPIYAAAVRHQLVVGIHYGGAPGLPPTSVGWPSTYLEEYVGMSQVFQAQVLSLVSEGVFDKFPDLRVALIETGVTWMPSLMWRFDKEWRGLRSLTPWVKRPPSAYIREHIRLTLQPMDAPPTAAELLQIVGQLDSEDMLLFSSDYPHWHYDSPEEAFPAQVPQSLAHKILSKNAREFYRL